MNGLGAVMIVFGGAASPTSTALTLTSQAVVEAGLWLVRGKVDGNGGPFLGGSLYVDQGYRRATGRRRYAGLHQPSGRGTHRWAITPSGTPSDFTGG